MTIPQSLKEKHTEWNEDGIRSEHPGYVIRNCRICGKEFILACLIGVKEPRICGRHSCEKAI